MADLSAVGATERVLALDVSVSAVLAHHTCDDRRSPRAWVLASHSDVTAGVAALAVVARVLQRAMVASDVAVSVVLRLGLRVLLLAALATIRSLRAIVARTEPVPRISAISVGVVASGMHVTLAVGRSVGWICELLVATATAGA